MSQNKSSKNGSAHGPWFWKTRETPLGSPKNRKHHLSFTDGKTEGQRPEPSIQTTLLHVAGSTRENLRGFSNSGATSHRWLLSDVASLNWEELYMEHTPQIPKAWYKKEC